MRSERQIQETPSCQQSEAQRGQQSGGAGIDGTFADQIHENMEVVGPDNIRIGIVDHLDGDLIHLSRYASDEDSFLPLGQVAGIDGNRVIMRGRGDTTFGLTSEG